MSKYVAILCVTLQDNSTSREALAVAIQNTRYYCFYYENEYPPLSGWRFQTETFCARYLRRKGKKARRPFVAPLIAAAPLCRYSRERATVPFLFVDGSSSCFCFGRCNYFMPSFHVVLSDRQPTKIVCQVPEPEFQNIVQA